jgi:formate hydrogenlyase subunit 6/NADH:ubiquinone oxidoreductase subunit I
VKPTNIISKEQLDELFKKLQSVGYQLIGPTIQDKAIVYGKIHGVSDLPVGWTDKHGKGSYRIVERKDKALFGYNVGPYAWKKYLYPPVQSLFSADKATSDIKVKVTHPNETKLALIGVRSCELNAITIQDRVFSNKDHADTGYTKRRKDSFIIAVNCTVASDSCFCTTMQTGPKVKGDFDLALTEVLAANKHYFILEVGSELGGKLVQGLSLKDAGKKELDEAKEICDKVEKQIKRRFDNSKVKKLLQSNQESPIWDELDKRCLSCANCTLVCPTCFCSSMEDTTNLSGTESERIRKWDSCFHREFSYMHGGPIRKTIKSRYRHWISHKLAHWHDQFGTSGCVGCGRCISWCPVGIDITEEVVKLQELGE